MQRCFDVVSMSDTEVVSHFCNVENPTSELSTSDQSYFKVDSQRLNNVDVTLKCWLGNVANAGCQSLIPLGER